MYLSKKNLVYLLVLSLLAFGGCATKPDIGKQFRLEKKYWDVADYQNAINTIKYNTPEGEQFPTFADPAKSAVIKKMVDKENFLVVVQDNELGLSYRNDFAGDMFKQMQDMTNLYAKVDHKDKYVYPNEYAAIKKWGLELQIYYFKLGNDLILEKADNPKAGETQKVIRRNERTVVSNFNNYLDQVNNESYFTPEALESYADGFENEFYAMTATFPNANYTPMISKAELMLKKADSDEVINGLNGLIGHLEQIMAAKQA